MEYNTEKEPLILKAYGRNIQSIVNYLKNIEDINLRNEYAHTVIQLMKNLHSDGGINSTDYDQKIWDDLHFISDFKIEFNSPYEKPNPNILVKKPQRVGYSSNSIKFRSYGKNIEKLIDEAIKIEDKMEQESAIIKIGKLMKTIYLSKNKDIIEESQILKQIELISNNKLTIDLDKVKEMKLFDSNSKFKKNDKYSFDNKSKNKNNNNPKDKKRFSSNNNSKKDSHKPKVNP